MYQSYLILCDFMSRLDPKYVKVALHMLMCNITYVIGSIAYVNIGHQPYVNIAYEIFNIIYYNFFFNGE